MAVNGSNVTAVLVATGTFHHDSAYERVPEVHGNVARLREALMRPDVLGVPPEQIHVLVDRERGSLIRDLRRIVKSSADTLLVYYCGHGVLRKAGKGLLLTVADTTEGLEEQTSLSFEDLRDIVVSRTSASARVLILDCCFAGQALSDSLAGPDDLLGAEVGKLAAEPDTYVIAAAGKHQSARRGLHMTVFTEALVKALEEGEAAAGEELTLVELYDALNKRLPQGAPEPRRSESSSGKGRALVRNSAFGRPTARSVYPPSTSFVDSARLLQRTVFLAGVDRGLEYLQLADAMVNDVRRGELRDLRYHYLGHQGAKRWIDLASNPAFERAVDAALRSVQDELCNAVRARIETDPTAKVALVSLGCGDGKLDRQLIQILQYGLDRTVVSAYFPIDISMALLQTATREVSDVKDLDAVAVLPIVADLRNLANVMTLWKQSKNIEVYSLLGCTLGNFRRETEILEPILGAMREEDLLLVDARCYGGDTADPKQSAALLRRFNHAGNQAFAMGPIRALDRRSNAVPQISVRMHDKRKRRTFSEIEGTRTVVTELALDEMWKDALDLENRDAETFVLSWSNVYRETELTKWLLDQNLEVVARAPAELAPGAVATVAFLLKKGAETDGRSAASRDPPTTTPATSPP